MGEREEGTSKLRALRFNAFESLHQVLWERAELFITPVQPGRSPQIHLVQAFQRLLMHHKAAGKGFFQIADLEILLSCLSLC